MNQSSELRQQHLSEATDFWYRLNSDRVQKSIFIGFITVSGFDSDELDSMVSKIYYSNTKHQAIITGLNKHVRPSVRDYYNAVKHCVMSGKTESETIGFLSTLPTKQSDRKLALAELALTTVFKPKSE